MKETFDVMVENLNALQILALLCSIAFFVVFAFVYDGYYIWLVVGSLVCMGWLWCFGLETHTKPVKEVVQNRQGSAKDIWKSDNRIKQEQ